MPVNPLSLSGQNPRSTFQRIVQFSGSTLYDGLGNEISPTGITSNIYNINNTFTGSPENSFAYTAGEAIGGGRSVFIAADSKVYVYKNTDMVAFGKFVGMSKGAASSGAQVQIQMDGLFTDVGFGYTPGDTYYVSSTGVPTNTPPTTGFVHVLGVGVDSNTLRLFDNTLEIELI
jgi:hypothetical protein